jgi:hypothetical protein
LVELPKGAYEALLHASVEPPPEGLAALLHISAAVTVIGLAFLGLDHVQAVPDAIKRVMDAARAKAVEALSGTDLKPEDIYSEATFQRLPVVLPVCALCLVASKKFKLKPIPHIIFYVYMFSQFPFLRYFRSGWYKGVVLVSALSSAGIMFGLGLGAIWHQPWIEEPIIQTILLGALLLFLLIVTLTSVLSSMQREHILIGGCDRVAQQAQASREKYARHVEKEAERWTKRRQASDPPAGQE